MEFVSRAQWGAPASSPAAALTTARGVAVHWLGATYTPRAHTQCAAYVRSVRASHLANKAEGYVDIAYNLLVCQHGSMFEGRGAKKRSGANGTTTANANHYAVCALWAKNSGEAPAALLGGLRDAIDYLRQRGAGTQLTGHRDHRATECPGDALYAWVRAGAPRPGGSTPPATGGTTTYTVKSGDTLSGIGQRLGVKWHDIATANKITAPYVIRPGQRLAIPGKGKPSTPAPARPKVSLARLVAAARTDPPKQGTPVSYAGARTVEEALAAEGLLNRSLADGHFGTATISAYAAWQRKLGYTGRDADGIPGKASLQKLGAKRGFDVTN
ncbi:LysM peptidoglycan-binding domain-containing protein [Streptomyces sp. 3MP-14]|uniref:LysM peptidoglycan-binding domain-containing protein n=1 Tax=Streptomyces mimosae TaxID=2586635 RepID=A0A5N6A399_9ACTN|nr:MULTISPECIES: LysM peptidoglycan-binding domain-containing protein [Streptomyces]KAB8162915.1 LysM peptidoglycan-binding domain-containing protein [Streptomyces mimosae]KAB8179128.1 LysM peptidoglycan-binding domain-containing protein [Streptomyces sp. 3MP-14]